MSDVTDFKENTFDLVKTIYSLIGLSYKLILNTNCLNTYISIQNIIIFIFIHLNIMKLQYRCELY